LSLIFVFGLRLKAFAFAATRSRCSKRPVLGVFSLSIFHAVLSKCCVVGYHYCFGFCCFGCCLLGLD